MVAKGADSHVAQESDHRESGIVVDNHQILLSIEIELNIRFLRPKSVNLKPRK